MTDLACLVAGNHDWYSAQRGMHPRYKEGLFLFACSRCSIFCYVHLSKGLPLGGLAIQDGDIVKGSLE